MPEMDVLIVEDSPLILERIEEELGRHDQVRVIGQESEAQPAIDACEQARPGALVLDLRLSRGSGFDVLRHVKTTGLPVVVVVLTNYANGVYRRQCELLGAEYIFDKSTEFDKAVAVLLQLASQTGADMAETRPLLKQANSPEEDDNG